MGYVAVKGGNQAIENACHLYAYERSKGNSQILDPSQIKDRMYLAVDRIMSEGGLYAPDLASLALKQTAGDSFEASFMLRAYRATQPRLGYSLIADTGKMRIIRRISSAFKDIPGGQILGATSDYSLRLLDFSLVEEDPELWKKIQNNLLKNCGIINYAADSFPKVVHLLRKEGLLESELSEDHKNQQLWDITRQPLIFPASRSATLQTLSRGETGGMLALAYSTMRGYGNIHPTLGELRVGYLPLAFSHPITGAPHLIGEVKVTEAEILARMQDSEGMPHFSLGYGLCFGQNELKAISMAILDRAIRAKNPTCPAENQEFVLYHIDGIESMGFCNHWKLPHYVDFLSDLDRLLKAQEINRQSVEKSHDA